ncbi:hypothetical protein MMC07_000010 [Pseudocyphellaria aurata]|nr:hypothetical protein [Pseudocyphellaria aurata]
MGSGKSGGGKMTRPTRFTRLASRVNPRLELFLNSSEVSSNSAQNHRRWIPISGHNLKMPLQIMAVFCSGYFWIFSLALSTVMIINHLWHQKLPHEVGVNSKHPIRTLSQRPSTANTKGVFKTSGKYHMTMGLQRSVLGHWLAVDDQYRIEHHMRSTLLDHRKSQVLQCRPGSEVACKEVLDLVVDYLTRTYPTQFRHQACATGGDLVEVVATGEVFRINAPFDGLAPLEVAARLAMEDFNILIKGEDNVHYLEASATLFPVGWSVSDRIGWSLARLHSMVPRWQEKIGQAVERFFSRISPASPMERSNFFVQVTEPTQSLQDLLCQLEPLEGNPKPTRPDDVIFRWERQIFQRLPQSGAVLFSVKTSLTKLTEMSPSDLRDFAIEARSWPEDVANYKRRNLWGDCALNYCDSMVDLESK